MRNRAKNNLLLEVIRQSIAAGFRLAVRTALIFPVLPILYLLEPVLRVRVGVLFTRRIGHLAVNTDALLRKIQRGDPECKNFYVLVGCDPANDQLFKILKRHIRILEGPWPTRLGFASKVILKHTRFWEPLGWSGTEYELINSTQSVLAFTGDEEQEGDRQLAEMGIGPRDWFVCFHARDSAYLMHKFANDGEHWQAIDYKNCDIANYMMAAEYVTSLGGFAVRMGALVSDPMPQTSNPKIIDYATTFQNDFMDIYLSAKCRFFLGASSGLNAVPTAFGVPVAIANHVPHTHTHYHRCDLVIPRLIERRVDQTLVSFRDATDEGFQAGSKGSEVLIAGGPFGWRESSPDDILDLCKDMFDVIAGRGPTPEQQVLQTRYADEFFSHLPNYQLGARVAPKFLEKYEDLIFSNKTRANSA